VAKESGVSEHSHEHGTINYKVLHHNSSITDKYLPYDTQESVPTQREWMVVALGM